jgi:rhodanese-related sulfurtransferase
VATPPWSEFLFPIGGIDMATTTAAPDTLRIEPRDLKGRLDSGQQVNILDVRAPQAYDASAEKIAGAIRVSADEIQIDPAWPKERLTVAYCT